MMADAFSRTEIIGLVLRLSLVTAVTFMTIKWFMNQVDPTNKSKKKAKKRAQEQLRRLAGSGNAPLSIDKLNDYELMIAAHLVHPHDISVTWEDIAGLQPLIQELRETVILPIQKKELFVDSQLTQPPKGVLLHGPPGCGKTLIAKATAKEAGTRFINLDVSILTDKWYGESQKLAAAVFTLAVKLQPCIIFIDEIDSFLRMRNSTDHEATAMMKAQFMSFWDGLSTDSGCTVIIMGATNRPQDLDRAILRRMPATFHIPMPNTQQRHQILQLILDNEPVSSDVNLDTISKTTDGFSGSDLHELCRNASVYRVRDFMRTAQGGGEGPSTNTDSEDEYHDALRPITMDDLIKSLKKMKESKMHCLVLRLSLVTAVTFMTIKWFMNQVDPTNKSKKKAKKRAQEQLRRLAGSGNAPLSIDKLNDYELMIAAHLVHPHDISVTWEDIAGLQPLIQELRETVILPIQKKELFVDSQLTQPPKGVLLHGPPGCGKTLIAKATAKEAGTRFINLDVSILTDKWYGESQKLAAAVFTLAVKLQPCIIFIDEIDSFLRMRNSTDHEATAMMKAQFMSFWDGLSTDSGCTVIIMGATNRPQDLDRAILRRMPATFHIPMPNTQQRHQILQLILDNEPVSSDVNLDTISKTTDGFSGSDLHELCRNASVYRVRDFMRTAQGGGEGPSTNTDSEDEYHDALRPITMDDLIKSLKKMKESKMHCGSLPLPRIDMD
ncbi:hypothetical protein FQR65_LT01437 [Abscondita terminalis]|nr:hypothetical protein FQR65_LT01437 [Abscondita terminalis]